MFDSLSNAATPFDAAPLSVLGQSFAPHDLVVVALLVVLEGILSIDNALVLALLARRLPPDEQKKALSYGLVGALLFRSIATVLAAYLLHWDVVKLIGGGYLVYIAVKDLLFGDHAADVREPGALQIVESASKSRGRQFWLTVLVIELTDIAFAVDSIVAAIGVVGPPPVRGQRHPKLWVVLLGGFLGVVVMRFAAAVFIRLLQRFPRFELAAYLLVLIIGLKLVLDYMLHLDFQNADSPAFWIFWTAMLSAFCVGFLPAKARKTPAPASPD